jgi:hypothetical protein
MQDTTAQSGEAKSVGPAGGATFFSMLAELIQFYANQRRPSVLRLRNAFGETGLLAIFQGELVHAETSAHQGVEAFYQIASWGDGRIIRRTTERTKHTIDRPLMRLLLDAFWGLDEEQMRQGKSLFDAAALSLDEPTAVNDKFEQRVTARQSETLDGKVFQRLLMFERVYKRMSSIPEVVSFDLFDRSGNSLLGFMTLPPFSMRELLREGGSPLGAIEQYTRISDRVRVVREMPTIQAFLYAEFLAVHLSVADINELIIDAAIMVEDVLGAR